MFKHYNYTIDILYMRPPYTFDFTYLTNGPDHKPCSCETAYHWANYPIDVPQVMRSLFLHHLRERPHVYQNTVIGTLLFREALRPIRMSCLCKKALCIVDWVSTVPVIRQAVRGRSAGLLEGSLRSSSVSIGRQKCLLLGISRNIRISC